MLPVGTFGCPGVSLLGAVSASVAPTSSSMKVGCASIQASVVQQQATAVVKKRNQMVQIKATDVNNTLLLKPKIQEDLIIAREIVINDADPAMRYKLTKRQTQEEIQKCTGAVIITRGKYRPPNAVPDGEKPLYLHISAGAQLTETVERILAVDRAASMVEDMLKQVSQLLNACIYLGFDADPSLKIASRIHGPNLLLTSPYNGRDCFFGGRGCFLDLQDQYINHIKNETGTTVVLCGRGSGYLGNTQGEEGHQPLHLLLSSNNQKSLEDAKLLAENLLDTISQECGANRVSSSKVYNVVPPPQQLLVGIQSSGIDLHSNMSSAESIACSGATLMPGPPLPSVVVPVVPTAVSCGQVMQPGASLALDHALTNDFPYSQPHLTACKSYSAYAGIYPQAIPLQQVTLGRRQSGPVSSTISPAAAASKVMPKSSSDSEKRKRKFQESPAAFKGVAASQQESQHQDLFPSSMENKKKYSVFLPPPSLKGRLPLPSSSSPTTSLASRSMLLLQDSIKDMLPPSPLPKSMHPPPHPKFVSSVYVSTVSDKDNISNRSSSPSVSVVSDTLVKLVEYGEDGDDD